MTSAIDPPARSRAAIAARDGAGFALVAAIAFLTLVDLFAAQAILPRLVDIYGVSRATMGFAVNASTIGMAAAAILVALFGRDLDRRTGICASLALLAVPTTLLAVADGILVFAALRVAQGLCMATAFTLMAAYLAEHASPSRAGGALAAYVTGNVASNVFGRLLSAAVADGYGVSANFLTFAALNVVGAALVWLTLDRSGRMAARDGRSREPGWKAHLANPDLRRCFAIGFLILFVFIGAFTYVNFELVAPPLMLSSMGLGLVYAVFLPSLATTPLAGRVARRFGAARGIALTLATAIAGLAAMLSPTLAPVLAGMSLVAIGTFMAQAIATGHVGRAASGDKAAASGLYLASYYSGGLAGSLVVGVIYDHAGWTQAVLVLIGALAAGILAARRLANEPASDVRVMNT